MPSIHPRLQALLLQSSPDALVQSFRQFSTNSLPLSNLGPHKRRFRKWAFITVFTGTAGAMGLWRTLDAESFQKWNQETSSKFQTLINNIIPEWITSNLTQASNLINNNISTIWSKPPSQTIYYTPSNLDFTLKDKNESNRSLIDKNENNFQTNQIEAVKDPSLSKFDMKDNNIAASNIQSDLFVDSLPFPSQNTSVNGSSEIGTTSHNIDEVLLNPIIEPTSSNTVEMKSEFTDDVLSENIINVPSTPTEITEQKNTPLLFGIAAENENGNNMCHLDEDNSKNIIPASLTKSTLEELESLKMRLLKVEELQQDVEKNFNALNPYFENLIKQLRERQNEFLKHCEDVEMRWVARYKNEYDILKAQLEQHKKVLNANFDHATAMQESRVTNLQKLIDQKVAHYEHIEDINSICGILLPMRKAFQNSLPLNHYVDELKKYTKNDEFIQAALETITDISSSVSCRECDMQNSFDVTIHHAVNACFEFPELPKPARYLISKIFGKLFILDSGPNINYSPEAAITFENEIKREDLALLGKASYFMKRGDLVSVLNCMEKLRGHACRQSCSEWVENARNWARLSHALDVIELRTLCFKNS